MYLPVPEHVSAREICIFILTDARGTCFFFLTAVFGSYYYVQRNNTRMDQCVYSRTFIESKRFIIFCFFVLFLLQQLNFHCKKNIPQQIKTCNSFLILSISYVEYGFNFNFDLLFFS